MRKRELYNPENMYIGDWRAKGGYQLMKQAIGNMSTAFSFQVI